MVPTFREWTRENRTGTNPREKLKPAYSRLVDLDRKIEASHMKPDLEDKIAELEDVDFLTKQNVTAYTKFLFLSDKQFEDWLKLMKEFRQLLRSTLAEHVEASVKQRKTK